MSTNFSANQYEQAFNPRRMLNWELPKGKGKYPTRREGFSTFHANDRGHLLPNVPRRRESPWGPFVGTWDMPCHLPGTKQFDPSCRSHDASLRLQTRAMDIGEVLSGALKKTRMFSPLPQRITQDMTLCEDDYNNAANPAMRTPHARTEEFTALRSRLTPPVLPMTHDVSDYPPAPADQLILDPYSVVPRPPPNDPDDVPPEAFQVRSPAPQDPCTITGCVESFVETVLEEP
ncbi:hypothetical protein ACOMHN_046434 [Nucella lapillus]